MSQFVPCHRVQRSASPAAALRHRLGVLTFTAIAALSSGCGIGTVAAVAGLSDDNSSDPEQIEVLNEDSTPRLSRQALPEPALQGRLAMPDPRVRYLSEPTDELEVLFSKDALRASAEDPANLRVEVRRPTPAGEPVTWIPVAFDAPRLQSSRRLFIPLRSTTQLDGLYRVTLTGISDVDEATLLPPTTMYFVTQAGSWSEPELVAFGASVFGSGLRLTDNLDAYAVTEAQFDQNVGGTPGRIWTSSILFGRFGGAWQAPRLVWQSPFSSAPDEYQTNTGGLGTSSTLAYYQIQEGNINVPLSTNIRLRVPTAVIENGEVDFGDPVEGVAGMQEGVIDIGDATTSPLLLANHLSYSPLLAGADAPAPTPANPTPMSRLLASWWSFTDIGGGSYGQLGVYANDLEIDVRPGSNRDWSARDWGGATHLSAGTPFASWPFMVTLPDGRTIALWWTANSLTDLLSANLGGGGRYQYAEYPAIGSGTQAWTTMPPLTTTGPLYPITEVRALSDNRVAIFTQGGGAAPEVRILDLATGVLNPATSPMGSFSLVLPYVPFLNTPLPPFSSPTGNFGNWRSLRNQATPRASNIGNDEFVVRWVSGTGPTAALFIARFAYDPATLATGGGTWNDINAVPSSVTDAGNIALGVDSLGWATLLTNEVVSSTETLVSARRTNILVNGLSSLPAAVSEPLSDSMPGTFATFPSLSNSHSSGAIATGWNFGIGPISGDNLRGTVMCRFR